MKSFTEYLSEQRTFHKVGDSIKWSMQVVSKYNKISDFGGMDHGEIVSISNGMYKVRLNNGNHAMIKKNDALAYGSDDATVEE